MTVINPAAASEVPSGVVPCSARIDVRQLELDQVVAHPRPFTCELTVSPNQVSRVIDHVSNVTYLDWLDRAAELHSEQCGYSWEKLMDSGVLWFVARHEIDYLAEVRANDRLLVLTWVRSVGRIKSWRDSVIFRPSDRAVVCRASTLWVLVRLSDRRPTRVPAAMCKALEPLEAAPADEVR